LCQQLTERIVANGRVQPRFRVTLAKDIRKKLKATTTLSIQLPEFSTVGAIANMSVTKTFCKDILLVKSSPENPRKRPRKGKRKCPIQVVG
jgi:hypothetical protein